MEKIKCKCGEEFECFHHFSIGGIWFNHCTQCGKGAGYDLCEGKCPACFDEEQTAIKFQIDKWYKENKPS
jgi:hypothetical protein